MQLQFIQQDYQQRAVQAVVQLFKGQPFAEKYTDEYGNSPNILQLTPEAMLQNLQSVQVKNQIKEIGQALTQNNECPHFTIEMETGTGKTYTFINTIYELYKTYGFRKFVIVTPSVAIREGTIKNLQITKEHFQHLYERPTCIHIAYDSSKLNELDAFAQSEALSILVMNIDSFTKDSNKINQRGERTTAPIEKIRTVHPIVIVDEPQNFETDIRRKAIMDLNPLCTLRYSATLTNKYHQIYSLNPVDAYNLGLVKQIEVDGIISETGAHQAFMELRDIQIVKNNVTAQLLVDVLGKTGAMRKIVALKAGDNLFLKTKQNPHYEHGYVLNEIREDEIEFSSGRVLKLHQSTDKMEDAIMRTQIERTVAAHFQRVKTLKPQGIKVLSLFFIDKVANYRSHNALGENEQGKFALWFEEIFKQYAKKYPDLIPYEAQEVHGGYFSGDKKGKSSQNIWTDTRGDGEKDRDTYALIMRDKEKLLSLAEPLQFIFSHSALREGWDNPNVFQICTLNETHSTLKKRQEIGRGLRLCVNQKGQRIQDKKINILTVVANESYESFANTLQKEIEAETGIKFERKIANRHEKALIKAKKLSSEQETIFQAIWQRINYHTSYSVKINTQDLISQCVENLKDENKYPRVQAPKLYWAGGRMIMNPQEGVFVQQSRSGEKSSQDLKIPIPDVYAYIQSRVHISRSSLFEILKNSHRLPELLINPQAFLDMLLLALQNTLHAMMVDGIEYHKIEGQNYEMQLSELSYESYLSTLYPAHDSRKDTILDKTLLKAKPLDDAALHFSEFECVEADSEVEKCFARDCQSDERIKFFFKLPRSFKIQTPLGLYNPDWAVVFQGEDIVYFVAETKSSLQDEDLRGKEAMKIQCGKKHFALADDTVRFIPTTSLQKMLQS